MRFLVILIFTAASAAFCGFEQTETGARSRGLACAFSGLSDDPYSIYFNPAGLARLTSGRFSVSAVPGMYGFRELSVTSALAALPTRLGTFAIGVRRYGFELYREMITSAAYAVRAGDDIALGVTFNLLSLAIENYGSASTIGLDAGVQVRILEQLMWGLSAKNINAPTIGSSSEEIARSFRTGIVYCPVKTVALSAELSKEARFAPSEHLGIEYWPVGEFALRFGASSEPPVYAGGFAVRLAPFQIDYAFTTHQELGWIHEISLTLRWGENNE